MERIHLGRRRALRRDLYQPGRDDLDPAELRHGERPARRDLDGHALRRRGRAVDDPLEPRRHDLDPGRLRRPHPAVDLPPERALERQRRGRARDRLDRRLPERRRPHLGDDRQRRSGRERVGRRRRVLRHGQAREHHHRLPLHRRQRLELLHRSRPGRRHGGQRLDRDRGRPSGPRRIERERLLAERLHVDRQRGVLRRRLRLERLRRGRRDAQRPPLPQRRRSDLDDVDLSRLGRHLQRGRHRRRELRRREHPERDRLQPGRRRLAGRHRDLAGPAALLLSLRPDLGRSRLRRRGFGRTDPSTLPTGSSGSRRPRERRRRCISSSGPDCATSR